MWCCVTYSPRWAARRTSRASGSFITSTNEAGTIRLPSARKSVSNTRSRTSSANHLAVEGIVDVPSAAAVLPLGEQVFVVDEPAAEAKRGRRRADLAWLDANHVAPRRPGVFEEPVRIDAQELPREAIDSVDRAQLVGGRDRRPGRGHVNAVRLG